MARQASLRAQRSRANIDTPSFPKTEVWRGRLAMASDESGKTLARLGVYRIESSLGQGGMGEVFLAWDERLRRHVAIKRIRTDKPADERHRARFRREARAVARLSHPAIVQIFDILDVDGTDCIVMEHVEGESLAELVARGPLEVADALRLAREIAEGLAEAHTKGLVHRDLKPANVRVTSSGRSKILDFGLARALWSEDEAVPAASSLTESGALVGTVHAMSPEQASGREVDHRSDLFALGGLLYEMLIGRPPFRGTNLLDTLRRVNSEAPVPIAELRNDVPAPVAGLVRRLLAKNPAERPQNAQLVADELEGLAAALDSGATALPAPPPAATSPDKIDEEGDLPTVSGFTAVEAEPASSVIRVLVLTDLVDSTRLVETLGDSRAFELAGRHDRMARDLLARCEGLEIDKTDGFLLLFERPADAVRYSLGYHQALARLSQDEDVELAARVGIHLGEVYLRHNRPEDVERGAKPLEVEGLAKPAAARVMSLAAGRQTLLTRGVFDLARRAAAAGELADPELRWLAHGSYVAKGVDEPLEIFEVGVKDFAPLLEPADTEKVRRVVAIGDELMLGWRPAAGQAIPRRSSWTLAQRVGEGGFGEVWLASHASGEKRVFKFCFEAARLRALKREVTLFRLMKEALGHRDDIARILDWNFDEAPFFLEAEYTEGGNLAHWAEEQGGLGEIPIETRLEIAAQIADALAAAHSVGVLHKDIKPENVLIAEDGGGHPRVRLTDFGIGRLADDSVLAGQAFTVTGFTEDLGDSASGTRLYMAPELLLGGPATVQADVYSLGVVLYQLVVGSFRSALAPGWRRDVGDEVLREDIAFCVDGRAQERAQNAREVGRRLRALEARREELTARELRRRSQERARRHRRMAIGIASAASVLLLMVSIFALHLYRARLETEQRREQAEDLIGYMLGDLREKLEPIGRLDIVAGVGEVAQRYFAAVPADRLSDEELGRRAQALDQIGQVRFELGELPEAASAFRESLALTRDLAALNPADSQRQFQLGQSYFWVGYVLLRSRDLEGAQEHLRAYWEIARELVDRDPSRDDWRLELAFAHSNMASVQQHNNDLDGARQSLLAGERELVELVARQPQWAPELAVTRSKLGSVLYRRGELAAALTSFEKALTITRRLFEEDPSNAEWLRDLAAIHYQLGELWRIRGESVLALEHFRTDLELSDTLALRDPSNTDWQREVGLSREKMGRIYCHLGDFELGHYFLGRAAELLQELLELGEDHEEWIVNLATARISTAWCLRAQGRLEEAVEQSRQALALLDPITADAENLELVHERARALWLEGRIREELGEPDAARRAWIRGAEIVEPMVQRGGNLHLLAVWVRNLSALGQAVLTRNAAEQLRRAQFRDLEHVKDLDPEMN